MELHTDQGISARCSSCNQVSPTSSSKLALTVAGWRALAVKMPSGRVFVEWCCPRCWVAHKERAGNSKTCQ